MISLQWISKEQMESSFYEHTARKRGLAAVLERSSVGRAADLYPVCRWFEPIRSNFSIAEKLLTSYIFTKRSVEIQGVLRLTRNVNISRLFNVIIRVIMKENVCGRNEV